MPEPGEYKTVQFRILAYAQEIGWSFVPRDEAERWRGSGSDIGLDEILRQPVAEIGNG